MYSIYSTKIPFWLNILNDCLFFYFFFLPKSFYIVKFLTRYLREQFCLKYNLQRDNLVKLISRTVYKVLLRLTERRSYYKTRKLFKRTNAEYSGFSIKNELSILNNYFFVSFNQVRRNRNKKLNN